MVLNQLRLSILSYLAQQPGYTRYARLAREFRLSDRAVRNNVDELERFLLSKDFACMDRKYREGVRLNMTPQLLASLGEWQSQTLPYQYSYTREDRRRYMAAALLLSDYPIPSKCFEQTLNIAPNTVARELEWLSAVFSKRELRLVRRAKVGSFLEGDELERRRALAVLLGQSVCYQDYCAFLRNSLSNRIGNHLLATVFSAVGGTGEAIGQCIHTLERETKLQFDDETYLSLMLQIAVSVNRSSMGCRIPLRAGRIRELRPEDGAAWMEPVAALFQEGAGCAAPAGELAFLELCIRAGQTVSGGLSLPAGAAELRSLCRTLAGDFAAISGCAAPRDEAAEAEALSLRLGPVFYRISYGFPRRPATVPEQLRRQHELLTNTKMLMGGLEAYAGERLTDGEIAYIALQLNERLGLRVRGSEKRTRILLVCGAGNGTSKLVAMQLSRRFNAEVVGAVSSRFLEEFPKEGYDYIISIVPLEKLAPTEYIRISPQFTKEDQQKISEMLYMFYSTDQEYSRIIDVSNRLLRRVEKYAQVFDRRQLQMELLDELLRDEPAAPVERVGPDLVELLKPEAVALNRPCGGWEEAIRAGAELLEGTGAAQPCYKEAVLRNLRQFGPYMAIVPQVVLAHANSGDGVNAMALSFLTLKEGVAFGQRECDPIRMVITLTAKDQTSHLNALAQLVKLLHDRETVERLLTAASARAFLELLHRKERG